MVYIRILRVYTIYSYTHTRTDKFDMIICLGPVCIPLWGLLPLVLYFFPRFGKYLDTAPTWVQWCCRGRAGGKARDSEAVVPAERQALLDAVAKGVAEAGIFEVETPAEFRYLQRKVCGGDAGGLGGKMLLADWGASWCGPCRNMEPRVARLATENSGALCVVKLDLDKLQEFSAECNVSAVPTFIVFGGSGDDGAEELLRVVGANPGELEDKLTALLASVARGSKGSNLTGGASDVNGAPNGTGSDMSALVKCFVDEEYIESVVTAIRAYRTREGGEWAVSGCRSLGRSDSGDFNLGLVVCSGDMCKMVSAVVSKDGKVLSM